MHYYFIHISEEFYKLSEIMLDISNSSSPLFLFFTPKTSTELIKTINSKKRGSNESTHGRVIWDKRDKDQENCI